MFAAVWTLAGLIALYVSLCHGTSRPSADLGIASSRHFKGIVVILRRASRHAGCTELAAAERGVAVTQLQNATETGYCICRVQYVVTLHMQTDRH